MVRIDVAYQGELHTSCEHVPSGAHLETDAPVDNQGRGESFSPTDLLATALASCMLTVMGIAARRGGWALPAARVRVEKHMVSQPLRRVGRLVMRCDMPAGLPGEARETLRRAAETCPVRLSLHPEVEVDCTFVWPD